MLHQTIARSPPRLLEDGRAVEVLLEGRKLRFHALWLRDNAQDAATRSPSSGQRLITLLDIPADSRITEAAWTASGLSLRFEPEGKAVEYAPDWLITHAYDKPITSAPGWTDPGISRWDASLTPVSEDFAAVCNDAASRMRWLAAIRRYGFARLSNVPPREGAACEVAAPVRLCA